MKKAVQVWLFIGIFMIFMQVIIGGITRLTGSGLSITKWEIVTGSIPPIGEVKWNVAFDEYKATTQYKMLNEGMTLSEFKFIYFWEYFHRLWARSMGFVFIIPFFIFLRRKWLPKWLIKRLIVVIFMAALVASFGWIMVKSGFGDRPWVSAYKLTIHLLLALLTYGYLFWTWLKTFQPNIKASPTGKVKKLALFITIVTVIQIMFGGLMSGMHAGLLYPTFPDMNGEILPNELFYTEILTVDNLQNYDNDLDSDGFLPVPALVQVFHRGVAYLLTLLIIWFFFSIRKLNISPQLKRGVNMLVIMLITQVILGILTIINCVGTIPVALGSIHQGGAILLLTAALYINYQFKKETI